MTSETTASAGGGQLVDTPGRPAEDKPARQCTHWVGDEQRHCREVGGVRPYLTGPRCPLHTPSALQGKPEPQPGPGWPAYREEAK